MAKFGKTWIEDGRRMKYYYKNSNYRILYVNGRDTPVIHIRKKGVNRGRWYNLPSGSR